MELDKVVKVACIGDENCKHSWVYDASNRMIMGFPPHFINMRICSICGRVEEVDRTKMTMGDSAYYKVLCVKFHGVTIKKEDEA